MLNVNFPGLMSCLTVHPSRTASMPRNGSMELALRMMGTRNTTGMMGSVRIQIMEYVVGVIAKIIEMGISANMRLRYRISNKSSWTVS